MDKSRKKHKLIDVPFWPGWPLRSFVWVCEDCLQVLAVSRSIDGELSIDPDKILCYGYVVPSEAHQKALDLGHR